MEMQLDVTFLDLMKQTKHCIIQHFIQHHSTWTENWWNVRIIFPELLKQHQFFLNEGKRESGQPKLLFMSSISLLLWVRFFFLLNIYNVNKFSQNAAFFVTSGFSEANCDHGDKMMKLFQSFSLGPIRKKSCCRYCAGDVSRVAERLNSFMTEAVII